jgi:hypothetical protein
METFWFKENIFTRFLQKIEQHIMGTSKIQLCKFSTGERIIVTGGMIHTSESAKSPWINRENIIVVLENSNYPTIGIVNGSCKGFKLNIATGDLEKY